MVAANKVFVKCKEQWYKVDKNTSMSPSSFAVVDGVIFQNTKGEYEVAKDRGFNLTPNTIPELIFDLFLEGKTIEDLPTFKVDTSKGRGPLKLYEESNGDITAMPGWDDYMGEN